MASDAPVPYDFILRAGASLRRIWGITADGVAWSMTGWQSVAAVRLTDVRGVPLSGLPMLQATSSYDITSKFWTIDFLAANSANLAPSIALPMGVNYVWDWKLTETNGRVHVPLAGTFTILRKVS